VKIAWYVLQRRLLPSAAGAVALVMLASAALAQQPKEVIYAAGQPAMSIGTAFYSSLQQSAHLTERYAGVTVKVQPTAGGNAAIQAVASGSAFYTWAGIVGFLDLAKRTPNIVMISFDPDNPYRIFVRADSPMTDAADLKGKKIGVQSLGSSNYAMALAELAAAKLGKHDATLISVGVGATAADALRTGKIDAYAGNDASVPVIELLLHEKLKVLNSPLNHLPGMNGIVVSREEIEKEPHVVAGLCKAFYASLMFAKGNPEAAVINHWNAYPSQAPTGESKERVIADSIKMLQARLDVDAKPGADGLYGYESMATMQKVVDTLQSYGALEATLDLSKYADLRFAKECGTIDSDALAQEAAKWAPPATH
jgi:NitT/TauT family transport system substrate-binding protein